MMSLYYLNTTFSLFNRLGAMSLPRLVILKFGAQSNCHRHIRLPPLLCTWLRYLAPFSHRVHNSADRRQTHGQRDLNSVSHHCSSICDLIFFATCGLGAGQRTVYVLRGCCKEMLNFIRVLHGCCFELKRLSVYAGPRIPQEIQAAR